MKKDAEAWNKVHETIRRLEKELKEAREENQRLISLSHTPPPQSYSFITPDGMGTGGGPFQYSGDELTTIPVMEMFTHEGPPAPSYDADEARRRYELPKTDTTAGSTVIKE